MSEEELKEYEAVTSAATPGPWEVIKPEGHFPIILIGDCRADTEDRLVGKTVFVLGDGDRPEDQVFAAKARTMVPVLIAEVRRLQSEKP